jgi:putative oxidoreductase
MRTIPFTDTDHSVGRVKNMFAGLRSTDNSLPLAEAGLASLRILVGGVVFWVHGWHKVVDGWGHLANGEDWPLLSDTIQLGFPAPLIFTIVAALSQFGGGALLLAGAFTRLAAAMVAGTMLTAMVFNLQTGGPDVQLAGLYAAVTAMFVLAGAGRWSVDRYATSRDSWSKRGQGLRS